MTRSPCTETPAIIISFGVQPYLLQIHTDTPLSDIAFGSGTSATFTETLRLKGNGRVGIGTVSPQTSLHVASGDVYLGNVTNPMFGGKAMFFENQGGDVQNSFRIQAGAATYPYDNLFLAGYSNAGATRGTGIKFFTAPAGGGQIARVTIDPDGNVRIGTPAPGIAKLDVGIDNTSPYAVRGVSSGSTIGVYGLSAAGGYGVYGRSSGGYGVVGQSDTSVGVYGVSSSGIAGYFNGKPALRRVRERHHRAAGADPAAAGADRPAAARAGGAEGPHVCVAPGSGRLSLNANGMLAGTTFGGGERTGTP